MIEESYVSFETAKLLKERGFSEECSRNGYYVVNKYSTGVHWNPMIYNVGDTTFEYSINNVIPKPTQQMVMSWLREVHKLYIEPFSIKDYDKKKVEYTYSIQDLGFPGSDDGIDTCKTYDTHEEAVEAAIKYCLEKLI